VSQTAAQAFAVAAPRAAARHGDLMYWLSIFFGSTIGRKLVMAVTGLVLFGFVVGHMLGNLQVFLGPEKLNAYAHLLKSMGSMLWMVRLGLLAAVALHAWSATTLTLSNWRARPVGYRRTRYLEATYASRTMVWGGPLLATFVVYHLLHLTVGSAHPGFDPTDVYGNVVRGFSVWPVAAVYIVAMLALGLHLYHGVWSMLQTVGLSHPRYDGLRTVFSTVFAVVVAVGNISIPVAILTGVVR
jgi:succinate dehydrogenase / fumarate reductase, cytochrome b subunit